MRRLLTVYEFECDNCHKTVISRTDNVKKADTTDHWHELHSRLPGKSDVKHFCSDECLTAAGFTEDKK